MWRVHQPQRVCCLHFPHGEEKELKELPREEQPGLHGQIFFRNEFPQSIVGGDSSDCSSDRGTRDRRVNLQLERWDWK